MINTSFLPLTGRALCQRRASTARLSQFSIRWVRNTNNVNKIKEIFTVFIGYWPDFDTMNKDTKSR